MRAWWVVFVFSTILSPAFCQNSPYPDGPPLVLARLERLQRHEDICALVSRNGAYRLERLYAVKHEVFAGSLSPSQLQDFEQILNAAELRNISRNDVPRPMIVDTRDQFLIDVYRTDGEQHLNFTSPDARKAFRAGTDPVLKWLDNIQKAEHQQLGESSASHCMPPSVKQEPALDPYLIPANSVPYVMILAGDHYRAGSVERNCVVVYPDGQYRREKSSQEYMANIRLKAYAGTLSSSQVGELRTLLDAAGLKNIKHEAYQKRPAAEASYTWLVIPRDGTVQYLRFARYFHVYADQDKPGGFSGLQYGVDPEERLVDPVRSWLKTNVEDQTVSALPDKTPTNCLPGQH
jgi:hypothetical protein